MAKKGTLSAESAENPPQDLDKAEESGSSKDLRPSVIPDLSWEPEAAADSLEALADYAESEAEEALAWYFRNRGKKRGWGRALRILAIVFGVVAGLIPVLSKVVSWLDPVWATILAALAGLVILLDRFLGTTSGWVRYILAGQELTRLIEEFRLDWQKGRVEYAGKAPEREIIEERIARIEAFRSRVLEVVERETRMWAQEFRAILNQLDQQHRPAAGRKPTE